MVSFSDFEKLDLRVGTVIAVEDFPEAKNPAFKLKIDFGSFGVKQSSAQITQLYKKKDLVGTQVVCVVNFPAKSVAGFKSECLVLGAVLPDKKVVLLKPESKAENGARIH